jgi:hypothetical protein
MQRSPDAEDGDGVDARREGVAPPVQIERYARAPVAESDLTGPAGSTDARPLARGRMSSRIMSSP